MKSLILFLSLLFVGCSSNLPLFTSSKFAVVPFDGSLKIRGETSYFKAGEAILYKNMTDEELKNKEVTFDKLLSQ